MPKIYSTRSKQRFFYDVSTEKNPLHDDVIAAMQQRPALKERSRTAERIIARILEFVDTFISGVNE